MVRESDSRDEIEKQLFHGFPSATQRHEEGWTVYPSSTRDVARVVSIAGRCGCRLRTVSAGRREDAGSVAPPLIRLSLDRMIELLNLDERSMTAEVQSGIGVRNLEIVLNDHGMTSGFILLPDSDPVLIDFINDGCISESSILYGRTDQVVIGAEGVLPRGEEFKIQPAPARSIGPDILGLLVREHGNLSIVTSLTLKVWRQPKSRRILCARFENQDLAGALRCASRTARSSIRIAAGRIYAPGWPDPAQQPQPSGRHVAVFVLEGEQSMVEAFAVHVSQIIQECGGDETADHHLATRRPRVPRSASGDDAAMLSVTADWSTMADLHQEMATKLDIGLLHTRFSDFFHEGCRVNWSVREPDLTPAVLGRMAEILRRFGARLLSVHPGLEGEGGLRKAQDMDEGEKRARELKLQMDPSGILV
jgi:FAD/FMN-containing dehydrogenase